MIALYGTDFTEWLNECPIAELEQEFHSIADWFDYCAEGEQGISTKDTVRMNWVCAEIEARHRIFNHSVEVQRLHATMTDWRVSF